MAGASNSPHAICNAFRRDTSSRQSRQTPAPDLAEAREPRVGAVAPRC
jgi:hypothetical protein